LNDFSEILDGPEYFFCQKTNCKLRLAVCIQRQKANKERKAFTETPFMVCEDCPQGIQNRNQQSKGDLKLSEEERESQQSPEAPSFERQEPQPDLCEDCGKKPRLGSSPYCASCMAIRGNKIRARKKQEASVQQKKKKTAPAHSMSLEAQNTPNTALRIEFGEHASILREIEKVAKEEFRPVEYQVIYMLKEQLSSKTARNH
jgi:hypothetical protein